jgi:small GTP-binding protein
MAMNLQITCPKCKVQGTIDVPIQVLQEKQAGLITINVPSQMVCDHGFQVFVDRNGTVRGYQTVDVTLEIKKKIDDAVKIPKGNFSFKVILVGDNNVGKTSLIQRFGENKFPANYLATLGVDITKKTVSLSKDCQVAMMIWDIAGQRSIFEQHRARLYNDVNACFIVFDKTRLETFDHIDFWYNDLYNHLETPVPVVIIGNKCDLPDEEQVPSEMIKLKASDLNVHYIETSAKTGVNVGEAFTNAAYKFVTRS